MKNYPFDLTDHNSCLRHLDARLAAVEAATGMKPAEPEPAPAPPAADLTAVREALRQALSAALASGAL